ncbi:MAG: DUF624 domain-containing protein [Patescibacteria group bacterium]
MLRKLPAVPTVMRSLAGGIKAAYDNLGLTAIHSAFWFLAHIPFWFVLYGAIGQVANLVPERGTLVYLSAHKGRPAIYRVNQDGKSPAFLEPEVPGGIADPALSPDGSRVVFAAGDGIYAVPRDGGTPVRLTPPGRYAHPSLDRGGRLLAYTGFDESGRGEIYLSETDGGEARRLTENGVPDLEPSLSPDGKKIVFTRPDENGRMQIWLMSADGTRPRQLTRGDSGNEHTQPVFSSDGKKIAYLAKTRGRTEIFIMRADGRGQSRVTKNRLTETAPVFSTSGSRIFFGVKDAAGAITVYTVNIDGAFEKPLTDKAEPPFPLGLFFLMVLAGLLLTGSFLAAPANAAMLHVAGLIKEDEARVRDFFIGFKKYFRRSAGVYAAYLLLLAFLLADIVMAWQAPGWIVKISLALALYALFFVLLMANYLFPLIVLQPNSWKKVWKKAALLTLDNTLLTFVLAVLTAVLYFVSFAFSILIILFFPALIAHSHVLLFDRLLEKYGEGGETGVASGEAS